MPLPPPWAGVEQVSRVLIQSPLAERFDLTVIKSNVRDSNAAKGKWDAAGIFRVLSIAARLAARLAFRRPDLVYLTLSQNSAGLARDVLYLSVCRLFRVKAVAHLHGSLLHDYLVGQSRWKRRFFLAGVGWASRIVVCGESIAASLRPLFGDRVVVVPNATPPEAFVVPSPTSAPTVAYMAHLSAAKGFYVLLNAAEKILSVMPEARFVFAGERLDVERNVTGGAGSGTNWSRFEALAARYRERVRWLGVVTDEQKTRFLSESSLFVLPSFAEAFPLSILEAMAAGLPVVATPVGAIPDVVVPDRNGALVPPGDAASLADAILRILRDDALRRRLAAGAGETARAFSVDRQVAALANVFDSVLSGTAR